MKEGLLYNYKQDVKAENGEIIKSLTETLEYFKIKESKFPVKEETLIRAATNLLLSQEMSKGFLDYETGGRERLLMAFAVADALEVEQSPKEQRALLRILKLVSYKYEPYYNIRGSHSRKVLRASLKGLKIGTRFDNHPLQAGEATEDDDHRTKSREAVALTDGRLTDQLIDRMREWGDNTLLHEVRSNFGIKSEEAERPYGVIVTSLTEDAFIKKFCCRAATMSIGSRRTIVLPSNTPDHFVKHEYAHTQERGILMLDLYHLLFRALQEIGIELLTNEPFRYAYESLSRISILLDHKDSQIIEFLLEMLRKEKDSEQRKHAYKDDLFTEIIKQFGIKGFLKLARINPGMERTGANKIIVSSVYLSPIKVLNTLRATHAKLLQ